MMRSLSRVSVRNMAAAARKKPVRVAVTGPAGQIGYALLFRLCSGDFLGPDQPIILQCLELPAGLKALEGVSMELRDCAFPLLAGVVATDDPLKAFDGADYAFLVGAKPRSKGMERADLLLGNAEIFSAQGKAINRAANRDTFRCVVVGNPANTNALIAAANAPQLDPRRFSAMTRLDHNRGLAALAAKLACRVDDIARFAIWGNHSPTMVPDLSHCTVAGRAARELVDAQWEAAEFVPGVQQRGAAIIAARGASSAASAASAAVDHMRDWALGTKGAWVSMGVYSGAGKGVYGVGAEMYYSVPVVCENGEYRVVEGLEVDKGTRERMMKSAEELEGEKKAVGELARRK